MPKKPRGKRDLPEGDTSKRRFGLAFVGSAFVTVVLLYLVFNSIVYGQVGFSEVGGFQLDIGEANGEGLYIYPGAGDSSECPDTRPGNPPDPDPKIGEEVLPQIYLDVLNAEVPPDAELSLSKDIDVPDAVPGIAGFRISLTRNTSEVTDPLTLGNVQAGLTSVTADEITLEGGGTDLVIDDDFRGESEGTYPEQAVPGDQIFGDPNRALFSNDPGGVLTVAGADPTGLGGTVDIQNAQANAHYISFGSLDNLREFQLDIEYVENDWQLDVGDGTCADPSIRGSTLLAIIESVNNPDPGGQLSVDVTVQNPGAEPIDGYVNLYFQGTRLQSDYISFSSTESPGTKSVNLTGTADGPVGFYTATVNTTESFAGGGEQFDEATEEVAVGAPPNVDVQITNAETPIIEGNSTDVTADITNTGDITANQEVVLNILGPAGSTTYQSNVDSSSISLSGGASTTETFTWNTESGDSGNYQVEVASQQDSDTQDILVQSNEASFQVNITGTNEPVYEGEALEATVDIENTGLSGGTQPVTLSVLNSTAGYQEEVANVSVNVPAQSTETVNIPWYTETGDADNSTYTLVASSPDDTDQLSGQTVQEPVLQLVSVTPDSEVDVGDYGTNDNTLQTDVIIENTAGPGSTETLSGDVALAVDRVNDGTFTQRDSVTGVSVAPDSTETRTLSADIQQESNDNVPEGDYTNMEIEGSLSGGTRVIDDSQTDFVTLNAPFYEFSALSGTISADESGGSTAQAGLTNLNSENADNLVGTLNDGVDFEQVSVDVEVTNTGDACGASGEYVYLTIFGNRDRSSAGNADTTSSLCEGESETLTPTIDAEANTYPTGGTASTTNPADVDLTPVESDTSGNPYTEDTGDNVQLSLTRPASFSYSNLQSDGPIQDANNEMDMQFDVTNNAQVTDTTQWGLNIDTDNIYWLDVDGSTEDQTFYTEITSGGTVTVGDSGDTGTTPWYDSACNHHNDGGSRPVDYEFDQNGQHVPNDYNVLQGSTTADASAGWYNPC